MNKVYTLYFWSGDANTYIADPTEVYSSKEKAENRKKEFFEKATRDPDSPDYDVFYKADWWDWEDHSGISIEESEVK